MTHKRKSLCLFCTLIRVQIGNCVILGKVGLSHSSNTSMTANKLQTPESSVTLNSTDLPKAFPRFVDYL